MNYKILMNKMVIFLKIGLNTYSFRNELERERSLSLYDIWKIAKNIGLIEGIELLDRHIPNWPNNNLKEGIKKCSEELETFELKIFALGPHLKLYKLEEREREKEINEFKRWIDYAADFGINQIRSQVGGILKFWDRNGPIKGVNVVSKLLDKVLPYAQQRGVKIGIETHWSFSSNPIFLEKITDKYKESFPNTLGIIFDWGNFNNNKNRYKALEIASRPYNHCHNHVKIFNFGNNFQQVQSKFFKLSRFNYDSMKIVQQFKKNNFNNWFSIEYEGKLSAIEGVYKSAHSLKYALTDGNHKIDLNFNWNELLN